MDNLQATNHNQQSEVLFDAEYRLSCQLQATQLLIKSQNYDRSKDNTYLENRPADWLTAVTSQASTTNHAPALDASLTANPH